jgi:DNA repair protein RadA/Sms
VNARYSLYEDDVYSVLLAKPIRDELLLLSELSSIRQQDYPFLVELLNDHFPYSPQRRELVKALQTVYLTNPDIPISNKIEFFLKQYKLLGFEGAILVAEQITDVETYRIFKAKLDELALEYVSGEESQKQIKMRAERITPNSANCYILTETKTQNIFKQIQEIEPEIVIIDSIQTLHTDYIESTPGSISQIRETTAELIKFAKETNIPVILIGHITKDGNIAGPKILEHMVDTVLQFEGDRNHVYRILRSLKNRFGSTAEIGIYEMLGNGLREVSNPSEILISHKDEELSGTAIASTLEGMRPLMIEIQSLVSTAVYGTPQRSTTGYNAKRLNMILAVLEKRAGFRLGAKDVFLNITGGISVDDPAIDLAVVAAILSSNEDIPVNKDFCFAGEVGLSGEIRPVNRVDQRIQEAEKLGFATIFVSKYNKITLKNTGIHIRLVAKIEDVASELFG